MSTAIDISQRTCQACGHLCERPGEFHPHTFCLLKRAGVADPWARFRATAAMLGVELAKKPPLVRNLPRGAA